MATEAATQETFLTADEDAAAAISSDWDRPQTLDAPLRPRGIRRPRKLGHYLAALFVGTVAPLVMLAAVLVYSSASSERAAVQKSMIDVARTLSAAIDSEIGRTKLGLEILAMSPALDSGNLDAFRRQAEATKALHGRWSNVALVRIDGARMLNLRIPRGAPIPAGNDDSFLEAARRGEALISDLVTSPTSNQHLVYVSVPVIRDGKPRYVLAATMESDLWTDWLKEQIPEGAIAAIDDRKGVIFARSERPGSFVGRTAADPLRARYAGLHEGAVKVGNPEGTTLYAAFHTSEVTGWHALILMPAAVVDAGLNRYVVALGGASLVVIALAFLAAVIVARPLRRATAQVKDAITSLGRGDRPEPRSLPIVELDDTHRAAEIAGELLRSAQRAVHNRTAQFEALLASAPIGAYLVDSRGRLAAINPTAERLVESRADVRNEDFRDVVRQQWRANADELLALFDRTLATGEPSDLAELYDSHRARTYEWHMERLPLPNGNLGVVCYFRDVSSHVEARGELLRQREELERTVASLRRAQGQLQAADRQKDEFLAMLAHELRNPLTPIANACELLARTFTDHGDAQAMVGMIRRQVSQLTRLVDDLLDVSRITQGRIELKRETLDVADVVADAVETVEPLVRNKGQALSIVASYRRLFVHGDYARLVQCVVNVLNNAAKYTDPGGRLSVETQEDGGDAVITVTDNGAGIPAELLPHVFDLFVQGDRTLDRAQGGLGIGLSVVQQLIEQHGGRVAVRSSGPGHGSAFEIRLPLAAAPATAALPQTVPAASPRRVLIVDDNVDAADSLAMVLHLDGHTVQVAYSGEEALVRATEFAPDIVFLDIGLPQLDGYEVARRLRAMPVARRARLVALTGYGQAEDVARARSAGFDEHMVKPVNMHAVCEAIGAARVT